MSNQVYENSIVRYIDNEFNFINNNLTTTPASLLLNLNGPYTGLIFLVKYTIFSQKQVIMYWDTVVGQSTITGSTSITSSVALPSIITPVNACTFCVPIIVGNTSATNTEIGYITISPFGIFSIQRLTVPNTFPNTTSCGIIRNQISYTIN